MSLSDQSGRSTTEPQEALSPSSGQDAKSSVDADQAEREVVERGGEEESGFEARHAAQQMDDPASGEFELPIAIPGAPDKVQIGELIREGRYLLMRGFDIFQKKPGVYEDEIRQASWWRFWLTVGAGGVIAAFFYALANVSLQFRFASIGSEINVMEPVFALVFTVALVGASVFSGGFVSYRYLRSQGDHHRVSLADHCHAIAIGWVTGHIVVTLLAVASIILFGGFFTVRFFLSGGLAFAGALPFLALASGFLSAGVIWYTLAIIVDGLKKLYSLDSSRLWFAAIIFLVSSGFVYTLLDSLLPG